VKECILRTLGTETKPSSAAACIAAVACIELPENVSCFTCPSLTFQLTPSTLQKWPELIDSLMSSVTSPPASAPNADALREASLESLGYICQDAPMWVLEPKSNSILNAIVTGMREEEQGQTRVAAANALLNALEFSKRNFENEAEKNVIMSVVCTATQAADTQIRIVALQCLVKIMSLYYSLITEEHIKALFAITVHAMRAEDSDVALQGIEFWSNVCEEEMELQAEAEEVGF